MSKLTKLANDPKQFIKDSKIFRQLTGNKEPVPPKPTPQKAHPLPTLNHAVEQRLSARQVKEENRQYFRFNAESVVMDRVVARLNQQVDEFMTGLGFESRDYTPDIADFLRTYEDNPAAGMGRTTAVGSLLWLFLLTRALQPKVIVESGVFRGASLHTLHSARGEAELYAYDIDLSNLVFSHPTINFHEGDWTEALPKAKSENDLCYFDDHLNNCLRIRQAYDQGFRHIIFDDSPDIGQLHKWRYPGVPTIQMVMNKTILPGEWVEWTWSDRQLRYTYREEHAHGVKELVVAMAELPSLSMLTGRPAGVQTYVRLRD
jgi:hypothetical protein